MSRIYRCQDGGHLALPAQSRVLAAPGSGLVPGFLLAALAIVSVLGVSGCGGEGGRSPAIEGTTQQVLRAARRPDDTGAPMVVNDGAFAFNDTSEVANPVTVQR